MSICYSVRSFIIFRILGKIYMFYGYWHVYFDINKNAGCRTWLFTADIGVKMCINTF